ncbi:MAG: hypothetical protein RBT46_04340 [Weeksellaceae bacterium]|jgi:hypothetical protein|nr:hypothetical protein [Weeksellaceae bacterium]MDX9704921.1 hypothetical protein [Weeksellaceae bacterium]
METISIKDYTAEERAIGKKYAMQMRDAFKRQISVLDKQSGALRKAGYRVRFRDQEVQAISVQTVNYAFVNYFGVDKERKSHSLKTATGKISIRKSHPFKLNSKIQTLEIPNQIIDGFADEISELRGDKVLVDASRLLLKKD